MNAAKIQPQCLVEEVHLWYGGPECIEQFGESPRWRALLSDDEIARSDRFVFPEEGVIRRAARVLLRTALSRYAPVAPESWRFRVSSLGKPAVEEPAAGLPLRFNLSHTRGLIAVAIGLDCELGVDVESIDRRISEPLIRTALTDAEWSRWMAAAEDARPRHFYEIWTLKESYLKARGIGLQQSLQEFAFLVEPNRAPQIQFSDRIADVAEEWQFWQDRTHPRHAVAVAAHTPNRRPLVLRTFSGLSAME